MRIATLLLLAAVAAACGETGAPQRSRVEPGEEPLETDVLPEEEVQTLEPEPRPRVPAQGRPCPWAKAWTDPAQADPLLAGIGGAPVPERVSDAPLTIPVKDPAPQGDIVVEIVIRPDGTVAEAAVVRSTEPPWPEAERAILDSVRKWRYEPPLFGGTPISVCTTIRIGL